MQEIQKNKFLVTKIENENSLNKVIWVVNQHAASLNDTADNVLMLLHLLQLVFALFTLLLFLLLLLLLLLLLAQLALLSLQLLQPRQVGH